MLSIQSRTGSLRCPSAAICGGRPEHRKILGLAAQYVSREPSFSELTYEDFQCNDQKSAVGRSILTIPLERAM
jgi:hypothetical protein